MEAGQKTAAEAAAKTSPVTTKEKVVLSGLLQVHGLGYISEDERTGGRSGNDTIRLRRGELRLTAPNITDRVSGTVMFDPSKSIAGNTNIANNQNLNIRARDNVLQEIAVTYQLSKLGDKNNNAFIDIGQYKIPIGYESLVSVQFVANRRARFVVHAARPVRWRLWRCARFGHSTARFVE